MTVEADPRVLPIKFLERSLKTDRIILCYLLVLGSGIVCGDARAQVLRGQVMVIDYSQASTDGPVVLTIEDSGGEKHKARLQTADAACQVWFDYQRLNIQQGDLVEVSSGDLCNPPDYIHRIDSFEGYVVHLPDECPSCPTGREGMCGPCPPEAYMIIVSPEVGSLREGPIMEDKLQSGEKLIGGYFLKDNSTGVLKSVQQLLDRGTIASSAKNQTRSQSLKSRRTNESGNYRSEA